MSDPSSAGGAPPATERGESPALDARPNETRPRGRPRKTVRVVVRQLTNRTRAKQSRASVSGKPRGRSKGSKNKPREIEIKDNSPRRTERRAQIVQ